MKKMEKIEDSQYRKFAMILAVGLSVLFALIPWLRHHELATWPLYVSAGMMTSALVQPQLLKIIYHPWMKLGAVLGYINTRIILGLVFFVILTPIALVRRLCCRDPLNMNLDPNAPSYRKISTVHNKEHMEKPF